MFIYLFTLTAFLAVIILIIRGKSSIQRMHMSLWLAISFSFLLLTHVFSGIKYNIGSIINILPYLLLCLLLMVFGEKIGYHINFVSRNKKISVTNKRLALISIIGSALFIFDILRLNGIVFGRRIEDFQVSIIGVIGNILASFGIISWLSGLYNYIIYKQKISILSLASILAYVAGGILSAGRQALILILFSSLVMSVWGKRRKKELNSTPSEEQKGRKPIGLIIFTALFVSYFLFISSVRSGIFDINNKISMLEREFNATTSESTLSDVAKLKPLSDIYIEALYYYSHEIRRLDILYEYYDYIPLFGLSQLSYIERRLQWLFGNQGDISWNRVVFAIEQKGKFSSHTWGTFISNFIVDFGRFGTLIACLISGILIGILFRSLKRNITQEKIIRHCIILGGIIFSIQYSPFAELIWTMPLLATFFLKIKHNENCWN